MRLCYADNESGMTLAELVIALGLTSLLMILVVTGALFVKKYVADWSNRDKVTEELAFVRDELTPQLEAALTYRIFEDSILFQTADGTTKRYQVTDGILQKDGRQISRTGLTVALHTIPKNHLPENGLVDTLLARSQVGVYCLAVVVSDRHSNVDTLRLVGRNIYESLKYQQD
jgi:hypothetical protein